MKRIILLVACILAACFLAMTGAGASAPDYPAISLDTDTQAVIENGGDVCYFAFTPQENGLYVFYSGADTDTYGYLYEAGSEEPLASNDDGGTGSNFSVLYELTAGQNYIFGAKYYSSGTTGSFPVRLEKFRGLLNAYPVEGTVYAESGESAMLQVTAQAYETTLTYTWKTLPGGDVIDGETGAQLTIPEVTQYGEYRCTVEDQSGNQKNVDFYVYVNNPGLVISRTGEETIYATVGGTCLLQVSASGEGSDQVRYEWYKESLYEQNKIPGATDAEYTVLLDSPQGHWWYCVARDVYGNPSSISFYVMPVNGFSAYAGNMNETVEAGDSISLYVEASCSDDTIAYQWYRGEAPDGTLLEGKNGSTLELDSVSADDRGAYYCRVSDSQGNQADISFFLTVHAENHLQAFVYGTEENSASYVVTPGADQKLRVSVTADDMSGLTYQWRRQQFNLQEGSWGDWDEWEIIDGAEGDTYTAPDINIATEYYCEINDQYGNNCRVGFHIRVENHLFVRALGGNETIGGGTELAVEPGGTATLAVAAGCDHGDLNYRWTVSIDDGDSVTIDDADGATYTTGEINERRTYTCSVTDIYGNDHFAHFYISIDNQLTATTESGDRIVYVAESEPAVLKVIASCREGELAYRWDGYDEDTGEWFDIPDDATTDELVTGAVYGNCEYRCYVTDIYGNSKTVTFFVRIDQTGEYESVALTTGIPAEAMIADPGQICYFSFTPEETGYYNVRACVKEDNDDEYIDVCINDQSMNTFRSSGGSDVEIEAVKLYAGRKYLISVEFDDSQKTGTITACVERFKGLADAYPVQESVYADYGAGAVLQVATEAYQAELTYTWTDKLTGEVIGSATGDQLTIPEVTQYSEYSCTVKDQSGHQKNVDFYVYVNNPGLVISQVGGESYRHVTVGGTCLLEVSARGEGSDQVQYVWYRSSVSEGNRISGATDAAYTALLDVPYSVTWYCVAIDTYGNRTIIEFHVEPTNGFYAYGGDDYTVTEGDDASLYVEASCSEGTITYQWYRGEAPNGTLIEGENGYTLNLDSVSAGDRGAYYCRVSDDRGNQGDVSFFLTVRAENHLQAFVYGTEEESVSYTVTPGADQQLRVSVTADDMSGLTYRWSRQTFNAQEGVYSHWALIDGAEGDAYTVSDINTVAYYECMIYDQYDNSCSVQFAICVENHFTAYVAGESVQTKQLGETATLTVTATCDQGDLHYQWYTNNDQSEAIDGANGVTYTTEPILRRTNYRCLVWDQYGNTNTVSFTLSVENNLSVKAVGDTDRKIEPGEAVTLSVMAICTEGELSYQWESMVYDAEGNCWNDQPIDSATTNTLTTGGINGRINYFCYVSDAYGNSKSVVFNISIENQLTAAPAGSENVYAAEGESAVLKVSTSCRDGQLTYKWTGYDENGDWIEIPDDATASELVTDAIYGDREYECTVSDIYGNSTGVQFFVHIDHSMDYECTVLGIDTPAEAVIADPGQIRWFSFTPQETARYNVRAYVNEQQNEESIKFCIYDQGMDQLRSLGGVGGETETVKLYAGQKYLISVQFYNTRKTGTIMACVERFTGLADAYPVRDSVYADYGASAVLQVETEAYQAELTYTWTDKLTGEVIGSATGAQLTIPEVTQYGEYRCTVEDQFGRRQNVDFCVFVDNPGLIISRMGEYSRYVNVGGTCLLQVSAGGEGSDQVRYEWYRNSVSDGNRISGATGAAYTALLDVPYGVTWYCVAVDAYGNRTTIDFYVAPTNDFYVYAGYGDCTVEEGESFSLFVEASCSEGTINYQWYRGEVTDGTLLEGKNGDTLNLDSVSIDDMGAYYCRVSDSRGNQADVRFFLAVHAENNLHAFVYGTEDESITYRVLPGADQQLRVRVEADNTEGLTYKWTRHTYNPATEDWTDWEEIEGAGGDALAVTDANKMAEYCCTVYDRYANDASVYFYIEINTGLYVTPDGESDFTVAPGEAVTMKVKVTCSDMQGLTYKWYKWSAENALEDVPGAESDTLTVTSSRAEAYHCYVRDRYGNSDNCSFNIGIDNMLKVDLVGSERRPVTPGKSVTLSVTASCRTGSLSYQWRVERPDDVYDIPGATNASYTTGPIESYSDFSCLVTDEYGNARSANVTLYIENNFHAEAVGSTERRVLQGAEASLEVRASCDEGAIQYRWYSDERPGALEGETGSTYVTGPVTGNASYYCKVSDMYGNNNTIWFNVGVREDLNDAPLLQLGVPATVETVGVDPAYFRFIPDHDGTYIFRSQDIDGNGVTDPYGERVDANGRMLASNDNANGSRNFSLRCDLTAGTVCYFSARHCDYGDRIPFKVVITCPQGLVSAVAENENYEVEPHGSATLKVITTCIGEEPELTYVWSRGTAREDGPGETWESIPDENTDTLSLENVIKGYLYSCVVSDQENGNSREVLFRTTVNNGLEVYQETDFVTVLRGRSATLKVYATDDDGGADLTYEWYDNRKDEYYSGTDTYVTDPLTTGSGNYSCTVRDPYGNHEMMWFYVEPADLVAGFDCGSECAAVYNQPATLTVNAESLTGDQLTYRWLMQTNDGGTMPVAGADGATLVTEPVTQTSSYSCEVSDQHGNTITVSCLVIVANGFEAEPVGDTQRVEDCGVPVRLEVTASCENGTPTYSWQHRIFTGYGPGAYRDETVEGADSSVLEVPYLTFGYEGYDYYICEVRDPYNNVIEIGFNLWLSETGHVLETAPAVEPTCTEPGMTGEVRCKFCGKVYSESEEIPAEGHSWTRPAYQPSDDYSTVTASRHCSVCGEEEEETIGLSGEKTQEAGCEEAELTTYTSGAFRNPAFVAQVYPDVETAPAAGHSWKNPAYTWTDDNSRVTATRVCRNDPAHVETETVSAASEETKAASCEEAGEITWTSEGFRNDAFAVQTKKAAINSTGHAWEVPTYEWADDNGSVTARRICMNDPAHTETETVDTDIARTEPTCEEDGLVTYRAVFTGECFEEQTKNETLAATGHSWKSPVYTWAADNRTLTATRVCRNNSTHVETETVNATSEVTREAACEEAGEITWTSGAFENPAFSVGTKTVEGDPALGHDWDTPDVEWSDDLNSATATWVCLHDPAHTETETVDTVITARTEPTCEESGSVTYTASFTKAAAAEDTKTETLDATGHSWKTPVYTWADDNNEVTVTATRVCRNDPSHTVTEKVVPSSEETREPTCDMAGEITYRATFSNELFTSQMKKAPSTPATGHAWGNPSYTWDEDYSTLTATHTCTKDPGHTESETVDVTATYEEGSTCTEAGTITYTSEAFETVGFEPQTKVVEDRPAGHLWGAPTYTWSEDNSTVTATRSCRRCGAMDEPETVNAASEVTKAATCEEAGEVTWTSEAFTNTAYSVQTKKVPTEPTDHTWGEPTYEWAADNGSVTATRICVNNDAHIETETVDTETARTEPTCEEDGAITYTAAFTKACFAEQTRTVTLAATGHSWKTPTYTWSEDNSKVTATRACRNDPSHVDTETADATSTVTTAATCEEAGETTWTSEGFQNSAFAVQTKKTPIDPTGHAWGEPTYEWAADNSSVTVTRTCVNNTAHTETETVETDIVRTEPTCEEDGAITYTAAFTKACFAERTRSVTLAATGHSWKTPTYTWSEDNSKVTATRACRNDPSHVETETADATSTVTTAATCEEAGETTWTSEAFTNTAFAVQTKKTPIDPTGHAWGEPTYEWAADNSSVTAKRTCAKNPTHIETETVDTDITGRTDPTCETAGTISYTATFTKAGFEKQPKTVTGEPARGHDWKVSYIWADDNSTVTATRECHRCHETGEPETVGVTSEVTREATCTQRGKITYTSGAFADPAFSVQTREAFTPQVPHQLTAYPGSENLCEQGGTKPYWECETCHKLFNDENGETEIDYPVVIPPAGHQLTKHAAVAATCVSKGTEAYWECETCHKLFSDENGGTEISNPIEIPPAGHQLTKHAAVTATCTKAGNSAYWSCGTCGKYFSDADGKTGIAKDSWVIAALGHDIEHHNAKAATCDEEGWQAYDTCKRCDYTTYAKTAALGHSWGSPTYVWAADNSAVTATQACTRDSSHVVSETVETIYKVTKQPTYTAAGTGLYTSKAFTKTTAFKVQTKQITLDILPRTSIKKAKVTAIDDQVYTGSAIRPKLTVKLNGTKLVKGTDYTVSFKDNVKPGKAMVTIKGKNGYKGSITVTFKILPKPVKLVSVKAGKKKITVTWKKGKEITGYEIEYSTKKDFSKSKIVTIADKATVTTKIKNLKAGKTYYVRVRTYKKVGSKMYYSEWSDKKKVKVPEK